MTGSPTLTNEGKVGRRRRSIFFGGALFIVGKNPFVCITFSPTDVNIAHFLYSSPSIGGSRGQKCCQIIG